MNKRQIAKALRIEAQRDREYRKSLHPLIRSRVQSVTKPEQYGTIIGIEGENNGMNTIDPIIVRWDNDRNGLKANQSEKSIKLDKTP